MPPAGRRVKTTEACYVLVSYHAMCWCPRAGGGLGAAGLCWLPRGTPATPIHCAFLPLLYQTNSFNTYGDTFIHIYEDREGHVCSPLLLLPLDAT